MSIASHLTQTTRNSAEFFFGDVTMLPQHGTGAPEVGDIWAYLQKFDVFPKYDSDVVTRSKAGGIGTL